MFANGLHLEGLVESLPSVTTTPRLSRFRSSLHRGRFPGTGSALQQADSTRSGAGGLQQPKDQNRRQDTRSGRDSSLPPHLLQKTKAPSPNQNASSAGLGRGSPAVLEQSASSEAGRQRPSTSEQPEGAGRAETFRQQAAPHLSQSAEQRQQPSQGPEIQASTGSKNTIRELLARNGIYLKHYAPAQYNALICPTCKGGSSSEESLSVKIEEKGESAVWKCHRGTCGWEGGCSLLSDSPAAPAHGRRAGASETGLVSMSRKRKSEVAKRPNTAHLRPLSQRTQDFFAARGISPSTLQRNGVRETPQGDIAFLYFRDGEVINIKYRSLDKRFWQVPGAEKILYGLDDVRDSGEVIVVEGEMDKLALEEAGITNVVSVPDGAPRQVKEGGLPPPEEDTKYLYLWNCRAILDQAVRIVLATDSDAPGQALADELSRRLGRDRCWKVRWPAPAAAKAGALEDTTATSADVHPLNGISSPGDAQQQQQQPPTAADDGRRKDANEVLMKDGHEALWQCLQSAEAYPIRGLFRFSDFLDEIWTLYDNEDTAGHAVSTGWLEVDRYYRVVPGELSIVTGVPNSGKSEWIDALICNLAQQHGWSFALCSMEKKVKDHARQLLEKFVGRPFLDPQQARYGEEGSRMGAGDVEKGLAWLDDRFHVIRYEDDELPSVDWVLDLARAAVLRYGIRGLVIDPYNELDHQRPLHMTETEYVSQMLTKIKRFAQHNDVHVWFVAHPRQLQGWRGDPPNLYDISGSAHFINKADNGIVIHRNRDPDKGALKHVKVLVRKVRNKAAGTIGDCTLEYDRATGRYYDVADSVKA
ncbi:hypothetical protein CVIRNUC_010720 [Coccomyxa viridis]|uniref:SF4 helicase domain-containing protein n=1 Tax=Coccomyxa viridis TaxID=1274662 RepID=A0AAV1IMM4_9CHLO|nr:hypothetical protein CVIRNUC_010720 [Coccomyxa viridis]